MGTAGIAHGSAEVKHPAEQGMMGILEVFFDTIVICTMTALVILVSGETIPYGTDGGGTLTALALVRVVGPWAEAALAVCICCFALATVLGWGFYGLRCTRFLLGKEYERYFLWLQMGASFVGGVLETGTVWQLAEIVNGLMAFPNLIALALLSGQVGAITGTYTMENRLRFSCCSIIMKQNA